MKKIIYYLKKLKKQNIVAIKQSLEDEGASFEELRLMRKITKKAGLMQNIKVGGCEAKTGIYFCEKLGVDDHCPNGRAKLHQESLYKLSQNKNKVFM